MILNKFFHSDQSSKTSSFHKLNFPSLSHKTSENQSRERTVEVSSLHFYTENQSATECSSAGRFFRPIENPKTTRAASHSFRMPKVHKPRDSFLNNSEAKPLIDSDHAWEVAERINSFKIRAENSHFVPFSNDSAQFQLQLWKSCSNEIVSVIKGANNEFAGSLSLLFGKVFQVFDEFETVFQRSHQENKEKNEELHGRIRKLQKELLKVQRENAEILKFQRLDEEKIRKEVEEMFPSNEEEIRRMKEESLQLRKSGSKNISDVLEKICASMHTDDHIPEATEIDLEQFNTGDALLNLQQNYKFIVNRTVKHVKTAMAPKVSWAINTVQTEGAWIEPKVHSELAKQIEKLNLVYQSAQMQLEGLREEVNRKNAALEKMEEEKGVAKNEISIAKREVEMLVKEVHSLKLDLDVKRTEMAVLKKKSEEKSVKIEELEKQIERMAEQVLEMGYEVEKMKKSRPPSSMFVKKSEKVLVEEEVKKSKLDEVTKSGLTVREEMEKLYGNTLLGKQKKSQELEENGSENAENKTEEKKHSLGVSDVPRRSLMESSKQGVSETSKVVVNESSKLGVTESLKQEINNKKNIQKGDGLNNENKGKVENSLKMANDLGKAGSTESGRKSIVKPDESSGKNKFVIHDIHEESENELKTDTKYIDLPSSAKSTDKRNQASKQKIETEPNPTLSKELAKKSFKKPVQLSSLKPIDTTRNPEIPKKPIQTPQKKTEIPHISKLSESGPTDSLTSENLDSFDHSDRISTSKYNENSTLPDKTNHEDITKVKNPFRNPNHPFATSVKTPLKSKQFEEFPESPKNIHESIYEESENYENMEENIKQLAAIGKIDKNVQKIGESSPEDYSPPIILINGENKSVTWTDKCCGYDQVAQKDFGIQVNMNKRTDENTSDQTTYFLPYNPNNIYGLRGDVYYQKSSFQPQSRIPDLSSSIVFTPPYKLN